MSEPAGLTRTRLTRFRVVSLGVVSLLTLIIGVSVWRTRDPGDLPDVGDPFDLALALRPVLIEDSDNAYDAYAMARNTPSETQEEVFDATSNARQGKDDLKWSTARPGVLAFLEKNRAVLEIWREGSERPDALYHQPGEVSAQSLLTLVPEAQYHAAMAALEGSRLEEQGGMAEAWKWYRAMLRSSRLVGRHGVLAERRFGADIHELAARSILRWASDPRVDAGMLRQALDDALTADSLTWPLSEVIKLDYVVVMRELDEMKFLPTEIPLPGGKDGLLEHLLPAGSGGGRREIQQFRFRASNEIERSRRAIRLVYANWLSQVDKPAAERAPGASHRGVLIYEADQADPPAARAVAPEMLARAIDETLVAKLLVRVGDTDRNEAGFPSWERDGVFARERRRRSVLLVKLAAELYRRERRQHAASAGDLLGTHLKQLPEGVGRDDPIPDGIE
jgi:hypothetical protein